MLIIDNTFYVHIDAFSDMYITSRKTLKKHWSFSDV